MARPRASLLIAVVVAAGSIAPSAAQTPSGSRGADTTPLASVSVLPPRALSMPTLPSPNVPVLPAGFTPPVGTQVTILGGQLLPSQTVTPSANAFGQSPVLGWQPAPVMTAPTPAPAWRWHGYGAVNIGEVAPPSLPASEPAPMAVPQPPLEPASQPPLPTSPQPMPLGTSTTPASLGVPEATEWQRSGLMPTITPVEVAPPTPVEVPPPSLSTAVEPSWRSASVRPAAPVNPMRLVTSASEPWTAAGQRQPTTNPMVIASATPPAPPRTNASVSLSAPRPAAPGSYTPRAVPDEGVRPAIAVGNAPTVQPASYTRPNPPPPTRPTLPQPTPTSVRPTVAPQRPAPPPATPTNAPPPTVALLKANIERICAGRGRDLEVYVRGSGSLLVRIKVRQPADADYLAHHISQLPELRPYQVLYEMQVGR